MANPFLTDVKVNGTEQHAGGLGRLTFPDTKGAPAVIESDVTAPAELKIKLLVGSTADYEVRLDGKAIGTGKGAGKDAPRPRELRSHAARRQAHGFNGGGFRRRSGVCSLPRS